MRWFVLIVLVALVGLVWSGLVVVDQTEYVVFKRFGNPVRTVLEPGLKLKYPWPIDSVVRFDNRLRVLEVPAPGEADKEYLTQDEQAGIGKNVVVTTYTCWRIKPDAKSVLAFLETMGDRARAEARLSDVVVSELGAALGTHDFSVLVAVSPEGSGWAELMDGIRDRCRQRVEGPYGIEIIDVKIQRLNFPDQNRRSVFDRMRAERATIAARYRSEGEERAMAIQARANREREEIVARAKMEAEQIRGRADAEAARLYAEVHAQDPGFYEFLRTLEGYEKTFDEQTVVILSADSAFLRLLNQAVRSAPDDPLEQLDGVHQPATQPARAE